MSKINELINKLCPNGVEYTTIEKIADTSIGLATSVTSNKTSNGVQLLHNSDIKPNRIQVKNVEYVSNEFAQKNKNKIHRLYDIVSVHTGDVGTSAVIEEEFVGTIGFTTLITRIKDFNKVNPYYLSHYLNSNIIKQQIQKVSISDRNNLNQKSFNKLIVAVPPMEVQNEIVHILDDFTLLSAELSAELKARQKQYEYYSEKLLNDDCEGSYVRLGDITKIITKGTTPKKFTNSGINFIKTEAFEGININKDKLSFVDEETHTTFLKRSILEENDILFTIAGATIGKMAIVNKELLPANTNQALAIIRLKDNINTNYIKFILQSSFMKKYIKKCVKGSAQPNLNLQQLNDFVVPFPSNEKQIEIMNILEKFEKLSNDIFEGLPAEIEARQKQYEYYRDKLLTFKELKVEN